MFLETITFFGNVVLVPINRIKYINATYEDETYRIKIVSDDGDWEEYYGNDEINYNLRYENIKEILGVNIDEHKNGSHRRDKTL